MVENIMHLSIFQGIEAKIIKHIIDNCEIRNYDALVDIISEGEESNGEGYILKSGHVYVMIGGKKVAELHPGDIFGEIALLSEENRTATIKSMDDVEVIILSLENLLEMINNGNNTINKTVIERIEENLKN